jgi:methylenetetrahydrofolate reductase (NADPH)
MQVAWVVSNWCEGMHSPYERESADYCPCVPRRLRCGVVARIDDLLSSGRTYSFEFFPPKSDAELSTLAKTLRDLQPLRPSFVSVTYRGGAESRKRTHDLVAGMLHTTELLPMAHLICVAHSRLELAEILVDLRRAGIENLMALGGDPPEDPSAMPGELRYAIELVELARAIGGFSIGVAAHPAGHPNSPDLVHDRRFLAAKLQLADFGVTQFFFEFAQYESLVEDLSRLGIDKPVVPGIMPVTSLSSIPRRATMGAPVPPAMAARLERADAQGGHEAVRKEGIEIATELCQRLLDAGVPGLHFYTLNRSSATREIYESLGLAASLTESR